MTDELKIEVASDEAVQDVDQAAAADDAIVAPIDADDADLDVEEEG